MKIMQHNLNLMCGRGLDSFIPAWRRGNPGEDGRYTCEPPNPSDAPMLRFVMDEEGVQTKTVHFLFSYAGLRGAVCPEICHPKWNAWKRATKNRSSSLEYDVLRLTIAANYSHGAKITGERRTNRRQFLETFLNRQDDAYFEDLAAEVQLDRQTDFSAPRNVVEDHNGLDARWLLSEYLECNSIRRKGDYET